MLCVTIIKSLVAVQSVHTGVRKMKAAYSQYLYFPNIKAKELDEKLLKLWKKMNIF